jgi:hypothetical protein
MRAPRSALPMPVARASSARLVGCSATIAASTVCALSSATSPVELGEGLEPNGGMRPPPVLHDRCAVMLRMGRCPGGRGSYYRVGGRAGSLRMASRALVLGAGRLGSGGRSGFCLAWLRESTWLVRTRSLGRRRAATSTASSTSPRRAPIPPTRCASCPPTTAATTCTPTMPGTRRPDGARACAGRVATPGSR